MAHLYHFTAEQTRAIEAMRERGMSSRAIAEIIGAPQRSVSAKLGILSRKQPPKKGKGGTPRKCLGGCGETFLSPHPPSINRICPSCSGHEHRDVTLYEIPVARAA